MSGVPYIPPFRFLIDLRTYLPIIPNRMKAFSDRTLGVEQCHDTDFFLGSALKITNQNWTDTRFLIIQLINPHPNSLKCKDQLELITFKLTDANKYENPMQKP